MTTKLTPEQVNEQRKAAVKTAVVLAVVALLFYAGFVLINVL